MVTAVDNLLATFITMLLVDRLGRKQLLLSGSAGMTLSLLALTSGLRGLGMPQGPDSLCISSTVVVMIAVNLFVFSFILCLGSV